jgi:hypothetical protein
MEASWVRHGDGGVLAAWRSVGSLATHAYCLWRGGRQHVAPSAISLYCRFTLLLLYCCSTLLLLSCCCTLLVV